VAAVSRIPAAVITGVQQQELHAQAMVEPYVPAATLGISFLARAVQLSPARPTLPEALFQAAAHAGQAFMAPSQILPRAPTTPEAVSKTHAAAAMEIQPRELLAPVTVEPFVQAATLATTSVAAAATRTAAAAATEMQPQELLAPVTMEPFVQAATLAITSVAAAATRTAAAAATEMLPPEALVPAMVPPFAQAAISGMRSRVLVVLLPRSGVL
jgi:hypothetical protein